MKAKNTMLTHCRSLLLICLFHVSQAPQAALADEDSAILSAAVYTLAEFRWDPSYPIWDFNWETGEEEIVAYGASMPYFEGTWYGLEPNGILTNLGSLGGFSWERSAFSEVERMKYRLGEYSVLDSYEPNWVDDDYDPFFYATNRGIKVGGIDKYFYDEELELAYVVGNLRLPQIVLMRSFGDLPNDLEDGMPLSTGSPITDTAPVFALAAGVFAGDSVSWQLTINPQGGTAQKLVHSGSPWKIGKEKGINWMRKGEATLSLSVNGTVRGSRTFTYATSPEIVVEQPKGSNLIDGRSQRLFGTVKIGKTGGAKTFTIKNDGLADLTGLAIVKDGTHAKDFVVSTPLKTALTPGTSTTFQVKFKPRAKGIRKAAIHIRSNDADESPFDIKLGGSGAN